MSRKNLIKKPGDGRGKHPNSLKALAENGLKKGYDPRRNMNGPVPKDMIEARARIKQMFARMMATHDGKATDVSLFDNMIYEMITSGQSASVVAMLKAAYPGLLADDLNIQQHTSIEQVIRLYIPENNRQSGDNIITNIPVDKDKDNDAG